MSEWICKTKWTNHSKHHVFSLDEQYSNHEIGIHILSIYLYPLNLSSTSWTLHMAPFWWFWLPHALYMLSRLFRKVKLFTSNFLTWLKTCQCILTDLKVCGPLCQSIVHYLVYMKFVLFHTVTKMFPWLKMSGECLHYKFVEGECMPNMSMKLMPSSMTQLSCIFILPFYSW
jgi:hypothetical protein